MEHVDNDMDDLFRKAGDHYPLKKDEPDWDAMLGRLREGFSGEQVSVDVSGAKKFPGRQRWLLLLLLIPLGIGSVVYFNGNKKIPSVRQKTQSLAKTAELKKIPGKQSFEKKGSDSQIGKPVLSANSSGEKIWGVRTVKHSLKTAKPLKNNDGNRFHPENKLDVQENQPAIEEKSVSENKTVIVAGASAETQSKASGLNAQTDSVKPELASTAAGGDSTPTDQKEQVKKAGAGKTSGFYVGLVVGPDWSSVKLQSTSKTGYGFGVIIGYRFNKRWSVESGFLLDKKYYYSSGEYFNTKKTSLPNDETVIDLNGNCFMFEIPLNLRYDFATGKNHGFFAGLGLSSYIMKKENYIVNLQPNNGNPAWLYPETTYLNSTTNLFSILKLSAGYEKNINVKTKIRVQPYINIPLQGIGIGSMPISSTGIYFGITYSFR